MVIKVVTSEMRSVSACSASAVNLRTLLERSDVMACEHESYACELKTTPPVPFAIAMPRLTYNPIRVIFTPGSLLLELVR